jgi:cell division protein FtsL
MNLRCWSETVRKLKSITLSSTSKIQGEIKMPIFTLLVLSAMSVAQTSLITWLLIMRKEQEARIDRLTRHINREIGVAQDTPLCERLAALPSAEQFNRVRSLAEAASLICEGMIPDSGIRAQSFDGAPVVTGMKG